MAEPELKEYSEEQQKLEKRLMEALSCHHNNLFENCQCSEPGFCPIFSRTMGVDPPDWNWCQKTKSTEREKY